MERYTQSELDRLRLAGELYDLEAIRRQASQLIQSRAEILHDDWEKEPEINARSALFEALTAKGHLSVIESDEPLDIANQRTLRRLVNGWVDNLPQVEKQRRFSEIVEELIIHNVAKDVSAGSLPADTLVITISNIPKDCCADERLLTNLGYGVLNDKGMVRATSFEQGVRLVEQVSRSNSNDGSAERFFGSRGHVVGKGSDRILGSQIIANKRDFPNGVIDVQRALDNLAGPNIIFGEDRAQPDLNVPEYEDLREVSKAREAQAESFIKKLADFERSIDLDYKANRISYAEKLAAIHQRRKELVAEICALQPAYTKDAMGEAAVEHMERAAYAMASGDDAGGATHMGMALSVADARAGAVCGGSGETAPAQAQANSADRAKRLYQAAKEERKNWKWQKGLCVVKECPSRPAKIDVGPCSVCRNCQKIFDKGDKPKNVYKVLGALDIFFESMAEFNRKYEAEQAEKKARQFKQAA